MYKDNRTHRLMVAVIVLLVLVLLGLFALIGVIVLDDYANFAENDIPQSSQAAPEEPEEPAKPEEPKLPAESSREEESSAAQVIAPVQPQPAPKPQAPAPASSSSQPKEESSKSESKEYDAKTYEKAGEYDNRQTLGNVSIKAGSIILENKTIKGRLNIAKDAYGTIELVDCVVEGPLYIRGGETIIITDSRVSEVFVMESNGNEVILAADSESRIGKVTAYTSVVLDESTLDSSRQGFSDLKVASGDPTVYVTLVNTLLTRATVEEETYLYIDGGSLISRLRVNEPTMIHGEGEIELLTIASDNITSYIIPDEEEKTKNRFDDVEYLEYSTALAKPTGLAVAYTGSGFRLSWNTVAHATGYRVEMTADGLSYAKSQSGTSIAVGDDFIGKSTTFKVQATTTQAGYSAGDWASLAFTPKQVGDLTGFRVDSVSGNNVKLVWNAAANAESYTLTYQKNGVETATSINDLTGTTTTVTLTEAGEYSFTLKTVGAADVKPAAVPASTITYTFGG